MASKNGNVFPSIPQPGVLVWLNTKVHLKCRDGNGHACIAKLHRWPGMPQIGATAVLAPWPIGLRIQTIAVDLANEGGSPSVYLARLNLKTVRAAIADSCEDDTSPAKLGRQFFIDRLAELVDGGWELSHDAAWINCKYGQPELFDSKFFDALSEERTGGD